MKKAFIIITILLTCLIHDLRSQEATEAEIYLLTCGPGIETYSVYGHSALRIVIPDKGSDLVYNWGVFDFSTKWFAWKFAKGRLEYMLDTEPYESFLKNYMLEGRWVVSQKANLKKEEIQKLFTLIAENLKPENVKYRYDFFYDDCSTRIRDLFEKATGENLLYPYDEPQKDDLKTFRELTGEFQKGHPWMKFGVDLLMGSTCDKKASFRENMFLPLYLKSGLSALVVRRDSKMIPLLKDPEVVVDIEQQIIKDKFFAGPLFIISMLFVIVIVVTGLFREKTVNTVIDIIVFLIFSGLALMMVFFNFFTDHSQMRWNLNIIWLNPFIILCLVSLLLGRDWQTWFRITFFLALGFFVLIVVLPQDINNAFVPLAGVLILRSSIRAGFRWNPLSLPYLTEF